MCICKACKAEFREDQMNDLQELCIECENDTLVYESNIWLDASNGLPKDDLNE